jgi:hypothetical protein
MNLKNHKIIINLEGTVFEIDGIIEDLKYLIEIEIERMMKDGDSNIMDSYTLSSKQLFTEQIHSIIPEVMNLLENLDNYNLGSRSGKCRCSVCFWDEQYKKVKENYDEKQKEATKVINNKKKIKNTKRKEE